MVVVHIVAVVARQAPGKHQLPRVQGSQLLPLLLLTMLLLMMMMIIRLMRIIHDHDDGGDDDNDDDGDVGDVVFDSLFMMCNNSTGTSNEMEGIEDEGRFSTRAVCV